jgi:hypothetical protein
MICTKGVDDGSGVKGRVAVSRSRGAGSWLGLEVGEVYKTSDWLRTGEEVATGPIAWQAGSRGNNANCNRR